MDESSAPWIQRKLNYWFQLLPRLTKAWVVCHFSTMWYYIEKLNSGEKEVINNVTSKLKGRKVSRLIKFYNLGSICVKVGFIVCWCCWCFSWSSQSFPCFLNTWIGFVLASHFYLLCLICLFCVSNSFFNAFLALNFPVLYNILFHVAFSWDCERRYST